jgi:hypothetical protein
MHSPFQSLLRVYAACAALCGPSFLQRPHQHTLLLLLPAQAQQALMKVEWPQGLAAAGLIATASSTSKRSIFALRPWLARKPSADISVSSLAVASSPSMNALAVESMNESANSSWWRRLRKPSGLRTPSGQVGY